MLRTRRAILALATLCSTTTASADPTTTRETPAPSSSGLDFDLMGETPKKPAVDPARERAFEERVVRRRRMLQWHQGLGFVTLAGLAATCIIGQLNYQDKYGRGADDGRYYNAHFGLGVATTGLFAVSGMLAITAPNPYPKPVRFDSALVHKLSMALATAGMVAQIVLGPIVAAREGKLDQKDWALAHLVTGYATFGFMATGVVAYVF
jgi:hypothetical protein